MPTTHPAVPLKLMRHDGLTTGTPVVRGFAKFRPDPAVHVADLAAATLWDETDTELHFFYEDIGARHLQAADPTALLGVNLQVPAAFATLATERLFTLRFDRTSVIGPTRFLGKTAYSATRWTQALDVQINGANLHLNTPCTVHGYRTDAPIRAAAGDFTWANAGSVTLGPGPASGVGVIGVRLTVDEAGNRWAWIMARNQEQTVAAIPPTAAEWLGTTYAPSAAAGFVYAPGWGPSRNYWVRDYVDTVVLDPNGLPYTNRTGETTIGYTEIYVAPGTAAPTLGTTLLTATGLTVAVTGGAVTPNSCLPTDIPQATLTTVGAAYNSACQFSGHPLDLDADLLLLASPIADQVAWRRDAIGWLWGRQGADAWCQVGGAWYNAQLLLDETYARSVANEARYHRMSLDVQAGFNRLYDSPHQNDGTPNPGALREEWCDAAGGVVFYLLAGATPSDAIREAHDAARVLEWNEETEYASAPGNTTRYTGRSLMHVFQAAPWFGRAGLNPTTLYPAYVLASADHANWTTWATWQTVTSARDVAWRAFSRSKTFYNFSPTPACLGMRHFSQPAYDPDHHPDGTSFTPDYLNPSDSTEGIGVFMWGYTASYMVECVRAFGPPPEGIDWLQNIKDTYDWLLADHSRYTGTPYWLPSPPQPALREMFVYNTPGGGTGPTWQIGFTVPPDGYQGLNGVHHRALAALYASTGNSTWKDLGDRLLKSQWSLAAGSSYGGPSAFGYHSKGPSEEFLLNSDWFTTTGAAPTGGGGGDPPPTSGPAPVTNRRRRRSSGI